jgi:hypothetical protein
MPESNFVQFAGSVAYTVGILILFNCGDASQVSYKTLLLMFAQLMLEVPPFFLPGFSFWEFLRYGWNTMVIIWIVYTFRKPGNSLNDTYRADLDDFPFYWILLLLAAVIPLILTFKSPNLLDLMEEDDPDPEDFFNVGICPSFFWQMSAIIDDGTGPAFRWGCSVLFFWMTSHCLIPLMFIPQLRICFKLEDDLKYNVKLFLLCMIVYAFALLVLNTYFGNPQWPITFVSCTLAIFILGVPVCGWHKKLGWLCSCSCKGTQQGDATTASGDVEMDTGSSKVRGTKDCDLPTVAMSDSPGRSSVSTAVPSPSNPFDTSTEYDSGMPHWIS